MPSKREIAREKLHNLEPWSVIKEEAGDGSGTYEELRSFLATAGKQTYDEIREKHRQLETLNFQVNDAQITLNSQKRDLSRVEAENIQQKAIRSTLVSENEELVQVNLELNTFNEALKEKGVDDQIIKRILEFDHQEQDELVQRIETYSNYVKLRDEMQSQEEAVRVTLVQIDENTVAITNQEGSINRLKEETLKLENGFERAGRVADIANLAVEYGYSPTAFQSLVKTIENYRDLTPYSTNTQVFEALQEYQSLDHIKAETLKAQQENQIIRNSLQKTRGELNAIKSNTFDSIREAGEDSKHRISDVSKEAETSLNKMYETHKRLIEHGETSLIEFLENIEERRKLVEEKLIQLSQYELLLKNSMVITTAYYSPEAAKNIPLKDIYMLAQVVNHWVRYSLKGVTGFPSNEVKSYTGFNYDQFSLLGASMFLAEELGRRVYS